LPVVAPFGGFLVLAGWANSPADFGASSASSGRSSKKMFLAFDKDDGAADGRVLCSV
jgi:hypothetical protein